MNDPSKPTCVATSRGRVSIKKVGKGRMRLTCSTGKARRSYWHFDSSEEYRVDFNLEMCL
jgi:hypothetical protein